MVYTTQNQGGLFEWKEKAQEDEDDSFQRYERVEEGCIGRREKPRPVSMDS